MRPARALAIVRIALGVIFILRTTPLLSPLKFRFAAEWPLLGWPDGRWTIALVTLPSFAVAALTITRTLGAVCFATGYRARAAGIIASASGYAVLAQDALGYVNSLHLLMLSTLVVALTDSATELAIRPDPVRSITSSVWLVRATALSVYAFSGFAKLNSQFLSGRALRGFCEDGYVRGFAQVACASPSRAHAASIAVVIAELSLPIALVIPRTRRAALVIAIAFHVGLEVGMGPDVFGWIMCALLVSFYPHDGQPTGHV